MIGQKGSGQLPVRTAVVEFGGMPIPKPAPASQFFATPKVTVVHYGSENSAMPATPPKPEPMRTINRNNARDVEIDCANSKSASATVIRAAITDSRSSAHNAKPPTPAMPISSMSPASPKPMPEIPKPAGQPGK